VFASAMALFADHRLGGGALTLFHRWLRELDAIRLRFAPVGAYVIPIAGTDYRDDPPVFPANASITTGGRCAIAALHEILGLASRGSERLRVAASSPAAEKGRGRSRSPVGGTRPWPDRRSEPIRPYEGSSRFASSGSKRRISCVVISMSG
jgi:hypothetical protein